MRSSPRIVSLLPSATEIICLLGLRDQLVGVTHECDYPADVRTLPKVTQTLIPSEIPSRTIDRLVREQRSSERALYQLDQSALKALKPDLIITQTLCGVCAVAESEVQRALEELHGSARVVNTEPTCLEEVMGTILQIGAAAGVQERARTVTEALEARVAQIGMRAATAPTRPRVVLLEWLDPPFSCGHWNPELVRLAGGEELLGKEGRPSREVSWKELVAVQPEILVVACCGYSIAQTQHDVSLAHAHDEWSALPAVQSRRVFAADGAAYFSRPGPRLVESLEILARVFHPGIFSDLQISGYERVFPF